MYRSTTYISAVGGEDRRLAADSIFEHALGLCRINYAWRLRYPKTPTLEQSSVVYRDDSHLDCSGGAGKCRFVEDDWADWPRVLELGYGDCDDLGCELVAEEWAEGREAWPLPRCYGCDPDAKCPKCLGRLLRRKRGDTWHIQVLAWRGGKVVVLDPSRGRGMPAHPDGDDAVMRRPSPGRDRFDWHWLRMHPLARPFSRLGVLLLGTGDPR